LAELRWWKKEVFFGNSLSGGVKVEEPFNFNGAKG